MVIARTASLTASIGAEAVVGLAGYPIGQRGHVAFAVRGTVLAVVTGSVRVVPSVVEADYTAVGK